MTIAGLSPTRGNTGPTCSVCQVLARLEPEEAAALRGHLANPEWRMSELSDALFEEGIDLRAPNLARHARGQCVAREKSR